MALNADIAEKDHLWMGTNYTIGITKDLRPGPKDQVLNDGIKARRFGRWTMSNNIKKRIVFFYCMFSVSGYHRAWFVHTHSGLLDSGPVETGELVREIMS